MAPPPEGERSSVLVGGGRHRHSASGLPDVGSGFFATRSAQRRWPSPTRESPPEAASDPPSETSTPETSPPAPSARLGSRRSRSSAVRAACGPCGRPSRRDAVHVAIRSSAAPVIPVETAVQVAHHRGAVALRRRRGEKAVVVVGWNRRRHGAGGLPDIGVGCFATRSAQRRWPPPFCGPLPGTSS